MNLGKLSDHTVDLDLIPEKAVVLDAGCRAYGFTQSILDIRPKASVFALEPDPTVGDPPIGATLIREALVGDGKQFCDLVMTQSGEARFLTEGHIDTYRYGYGYNPSDERVQVRCVNISSLMKRMAITYFDVVKLDIESSEFKVLENWPGPIATQISVEFHDFPFLAKYNNQYYFDLLYGPLKHYEFVQHPLFGIGGGPEMGHWDSLLRLKGV